MADLVTVELDEFTLTATADTAPVTVLVGDDEPITVEVVDTSIVTVLIEGQVEGPAGTDGVDGEGVPTGGTTGQVLKKASNTDFDTEWDDETGGGGGGTVDSVVAGTNIDVDATDPANPIVSVETLTLADISDVTASAAEVNVLDGITSSTAELNVLDGVTATAAELNALDGITATVTELNFTDGVTSAIQTQLDAKQAADADLDTWATKTAPSGAVVGTTDSQTLTNKTLTTPAISSPTGLVKGDVGLGNVDNTADTAKPVSTAQQTALDLKADLAGPTFTGDPKAPTPAAADSDTSIATTAHVHAVADAKVADAINDATTDIAPSQNAVFDALALKAPLASPTFTGTPAAPTAAAATNTTQVATTAFVQTAASGKVDDTAYNATTWNGVTDIAPSKNAVRDKIESLTSSATVPVPHLPTSGISATIDRAVISAGTTGLTGGTLAMMLIDLVAGQTVTNLIAKAGGTTGSSLTHAWMALFDTSRVMLAISADNTGATWTSATERSFAMGTPYPVTVTGSYYVGICVAGTTMPTLLGFGNALGVANITPILCGTSSTGQTTPPALPFTAAAITAAASAAFLAWAT